MHNIKYILYSGMRAYELNKSSDFLPSKGMVIRIDRFHITAVVKQVIYYIEEDVEPHDQFLEVHIEQEQGIDMSRHFSMLSAGWRPISREGKNLKSHKGQVRRRSV